MNELVNITKGIVKNTKKIITYYIKFKNFSLGYIKKINNRI